MANLLMINGKSAEEARTLVNQTDFAQQEKLEITKDALEDINSIESLVTDMRGVKLITEQFAEQSAHFQNINQQAIELKQRRSLLLTGWDAFKGFRWSSTVYLSLLTVIIALLQMYVLPTFSEAFISSDVELPLLTTLYFTEGHFAVILLILFWSITIGNLFLLAKIKSRIKNFMLLPSWFCSIPILRTICHLINRCILLSLYSFLISSNSFVLPERNEWHRRFQLSKKHKCYSWADNTYSHLKLALELGIGNEYINNELDLVCAKYFDTTTHSMKLLSIIGSIILAIYIGTIVIAMYLPLFSMGSLI